MTAASPRVDCDVHHNWATSAEVTEYLPRKWRDYMRPPMGQRPVGPPSMLYPLPQGTGARIDAVPTHSGPAGSDYDTLREQLLDPFNVGRAILGFNIGQTAELSNLELATEMCRAVNQWQIERWLSNPDQRLHGAVLIPTHLPEVAAREIRRVGGHPRVSEVLMVVPGLGKPFGNPLYDPIYEAAAEMDLTIGMHVGGEIYMGDAQVVAGGLPGSRLERHNQHVQPIHHHLLSCIVHGVFEKYPALRLVVKEVGVAFFPWLLAEFDNVYEVLRQETTTVKRLPSDYFFRHVWVTTHPLEESPRKEQLIDVIRMLPGFEDRLVFSSDYPHHDADEPDYVERHLPEDWCERVFLTNAAAAYNWNVDEIVGIAAKFGEDAAAGDGGASVTHVS